MQLNEDFKLFVSNMRKKACDNGMGCLKAQIVFQIESFFLSWKI